MHKFDQWHSPLECAKFFGKVCEGNFLAHSIRELEREITRKISRTFTIRVDVMERSNIPASVKFRDTGCDIGIPAALALDKRDTRLRLAHELGHIVYNVNSLMNSAVLDEYSFAAVEESFAWKFAYELISKKSHDYNYETYKQYVYEQDELKQAVLSLIPPNASKVQNEMKEHFAR